MSRNVVIERESELGEEGRAMALPMVANEVDGGTPLQSPREAVSIQAAEVGAVYPEIRQMRREG